MRPTFPKHKPPLPSRGGGFSRSQEDFVSSDNDGHHAWPVDRPSPDLTYLHPDNLRIGSIGVFAGDWAWTGRPPRIPVGFVGVLNDHWNGWTVWRCTREVAEAVAADQQRLRDLERARLAEEGLTGADLDQRVDESLARVYFDGDDLVLDETAQHGEPSFERQGPGRDGAYCPMGFNWTWQAVDPADCDRIAGVLPAFGEHREFVMATHQPLRMPRLAVTTLNEVSAGDAARTATLWLDERPVGTVEYDPSRPAVFRPTDPRFGHEDLEEFVRACRWRGREVDTQTVLRALIAEYETALHIVAAEQRGLRAVILRDGDDHIVGTDIVLEPNPFAPGDRQTLAELFTRREAARRPGQNQFVWQMWTGRRWQLLGIVDVPRDGSTSGQQPRDADQAPTATSSPGRPGATTPPDLLPADGVPDAGGTEPNGQEQ
jgi:hypothetical protein